MYLLFLIIWNIWLICFWKSWILEWNLYSLLSLKFYMSGIFQLYLLEIVHANIDQTNLIL